MLRLELVCLAIVAFYVAARVRPPEGRSAFVVRFAAIVCASAVGENTMIAFYEAYSYASGWTVFIGHVPLVVVLVWPVVVDSALVLASALVAGSHWRALVAAVIVWTDALLIEPIAVRSGLWRWTDRGLFDVPLLGIAGWAFFTWAVALTLERARGLAQLSLVATGPLAAHALVLLAHWSFFRWVPLLVPPTLATVAAWLLAILMTAALLRLAPPPRAVVMLRAPGAAFFFVLLVIGPAEGRSTLGLYAVAFALPYLVLLGRARPVLHESPGEGRQRKLARRSGTE